MAFSIADIVGGILKPISDIVDHITVSGEDKTKLELAALQGQINAAQSVIAYEQQLLDASSKVVLAEAAGNSWLQRSWRPITMLTFLLLTVADALGWLPNRLAPQAWTLLQLGLGGYVVGRSLEKVAPHFARAIKGKDNEAA